MIKLKNQEQKNKNIKKEIKSNNYLNKIYCQRFIYQIKKIKKNLMCQKVQFNNHNQQKIYQAAKNFQKRNQKKLKNRKKNLKKNL